MTNEIDWDKKVGDIAERRTREEMEKVYSAKDGEDVNDIVEKIRNANQWIKFVAKDDDDLYERYKFRAFLNGESVTIVRGEEIDTT